MNKKFRDYQQDQELLFPPSLHDWVPVDHPAQFINEVVNELDLSGIYDDYKNLRGNPPYHPAMMVKILIYGVMKGIHSSRKIEQALYDDVGMRFLSGNQQPKYWAISEFRRRHIKALGDIFVQTIQLADKAGLIKMEQVAVDGTKIKANASKHSAMSYAYMEKEVLRLKQKIADILDEMERVDKEEDQLFGNHNGYNLPEELAKQEDRLAAIKKAKAELEAEAQAKAEQEQKDRHEKAKKKGKQYKPRKKAESVKPEPKAQRNFTDSESRIMRNADKAFIQGYNAQATVDAETQIILASDVSNNGSDVIQLENQINQVINNTKKKPHEVSADAGYYSEDNLNFLDEKKIEAFIPPDRIKHSEWKEMPALRGRIPKNADRKYLMRRKLRTKRGRARYKLRQISIEPVFGHIKEPLGLRQFLLRGIDKVRPYWRFVCGVHNIFKLYRARVCC